MEKQACLECGKLVNLTQMTNDDIKIHEPEIWAQSGHLLQYGNGADVGLCTCGASILVHRRQ